MILTHFYSRIASYLKRSWWVSPRGKVFDAGDNHLRFIRKEPDLFRRLKENLEVIEAGWVRVGLQGDEFYINITPETSTDQLQSLQKIYMGLTERPSVYVVAKDFYGYLSGPDFLMIKYPGQLKSRLLRERPHPLKAS